MHVDVPQWLPQAYVRAVQAAGSPLSKEELAVACQNILERWSSEDRHYHGLQHLIDTAATVETLTPQMHHPELVRLAAWYHGVVFSTEAKDTYTRNGGEDEAASAAFAYDDLLRLGVPETGARRVAELVRGIRSKCDPRSEDTAKLDAIDIDLLALRDAHMGTLAIEPQRYKRYIERVRKEYGHVPTILFLRGRQEIIRHLLERSSLFITPLARQWEENTRENLQAEFQRITAKLEAMAEQEGTPSTNERRAMAARVPEVEEDPRPTIVPGLDDDPWTTPLTPLSAPTPPRSTSAASPATGSFTALPDVGNSGLHAGSGTRDSTEQVSSLEACGERFSPGEKTPTDLSPEELKQLKREQLAAQVRKRIEDRQAGRSSEGSPSLTETGTMRAVGALTETGMIPAVGPAVSGKSQGNDNAEGTAANAGVASSAGRAGSAEAKKNAERTGHGGCGENTESPVDRDENTGLTWHVGSIASTGPEADQQASALSESESSLSQTDAVEEDEGIEGDAQKGESWRLAFPSGRHGYKVLSAATPEWIDDENEEPETVKTHASGMEREPDL
jgi:Uncharacterized protein conserved in bacteria